jgi:TM2 domain-containing membrane protein YozV
MPAVPLWSPGVAAVLSLVIPGAGQMYKGQVINGLAWLFLTCLGYFMCCVLPGVVLHLCCILGAASGDPYRR